MLSKFFIFETLFRAFGEFPDFDRSSPGHISTFAPETRKNPNYAAHSHTSQSLLRNERHHAEINAKNSSAANRAPARTDGSTHHSKNRSHSPHKNRRRTPKNSRQNNSAGPAVRVPRRRRAGAPTARAAVGGPGDPPGVPRARRDLRRLPREGYKWPGVQGPLSASCAVPSSCLFDGVIGTTSRRGRLALVRVDGV